MKHAKGGFLTIALFAVAATLLIFSVVGSSQAALQYFSDTYGAEVSMQHIGVTLVESNTDENNYQNISWRNYDPENKNYADEQNNWNKNTGELVKGMLGTDGANQEELKLGKSYSEKLAVQNTGSIDEYVRVSVYKYWEKDGKKDASLDSNLIKLNFTDDEGSGWIKMDQTEERTILFYQDILQPGERSEPFVDGLTLDGMPIEASVERTEYVDEYGKNVIETTYTYDGAKFVLRADVDAVQTHHAADAMNSAWGVSYLG